MISFFNRHKRVIFIATTATFLVGVFVGLGAYVGGGHSYNDVARVGKVGIPYSRFTENVSRMLTLYREKGLDVPDELQTQIENQVLQEMIVTELLAQSAIEFGVRVTDYEIASEIQSTRAFQGKDGAFNPMAYRQLLRRQLKMSPAEYEAERRRDRLAMKVRQLFVAAAKASPEEVHEFYLAQGGKAKDWADVKTQAQATSELLQIKAGGLLSAHLKRFLASHEVQNFLQERRGGA